MPPRYDLRAKKTMADQSEHSNQAAGTSVTMEALQAMMDSFKDSFKIEMRAMKDRMNSKIAESRSRSSSPAPQQPSPPSSNQATQSATQPTTVQPAVEDKRWRPEEIGSFDGTGDVYAFTDRLASIAELKTPKLIQTNLVTLLKGTAFN